MKLLLSFFFKESSNWIKESLFLATMLQPFFPLQAALKGLNKTTYTKPNVNHSQYSVSTDHGS